ncbi:MAG: family transporter substrate-binding protein [Thermomicrobiales bacterium]|nr:family transporter substrate-binding protein [Thermomicrobiales bacterium]
MVTGLRGWFTRFAAVVAVVGVPVAMALLTPSAAALQATPVASPVATAAEPVFEPACEVPADQTFNVALVIAQGGLGDQSYNDLADAGLTRAEADFPIEAQRIQSPDIVAQGQAVLQQAGQAGFDLVIDLEFSTADALAAIGPTFPETQWMIVNLPSSGPNITGYLFEEQDGSYLAGALAAMVTADAEIEGVNEDKAIGAIGGVQSTGIDKFIVGYIQGARDVDPEVEVLVNYANGFGDPARGAELANAMFGQGADIVYQIAGGTGAGVIQAAEQAGHFAIGVDTDQDSLAPGAVLTSMLKRTDFAVYDAINRLVCGQLPGGETVTLGLAEGAVGLSPMTHTRDLIPAEYLDRVAELRQQIIDGEIEVWNVIDQGYPDFYQP